MPVLMMNVPCKVTRQLGTDVYGQTRWGAAVPSRCAVVKLKVTEKHTTVRADSSGSRGHGDEIAADALLLMSSKLKLSFGDKIAVAGVSLLVVSLRPRFDVMGRVDHQEVECSIEQH